MTKEQALSQRYTSPLREAFYIPSAGSYVFAWQHKTDAAQWRNQVVILCSPMGYEYTHSHRSLRSLADSLAVQGFVALRFDFHGTGDSPGSELDEQRLAVWQLDIESLVKFARGAFPGCKVCLAGVRFGATLAYMVAAKLSVDHLLLWEPIVRGKAYVREMMALALFSASSPGGTDIIESAGFLMTQATAEDIKKINLLALPVAVRESVLLVARDDYPADDALAQKLLADGIVVDSTTQPGFADMMAEPQQAQVPVVAIAKITQWLVAANGQWVDQPAISLELPRRISLRYPDNAGVYIEERPCWYDDAQQLFAVSSYPKDHPVPRLPAVILVNSGSVHHVGPNRLYCQIARAFAALGYTVLRLDLEGLGDSCKPDVERENHPYQKNAVANVYQAMDYLLQQGAADRFIVAGVCSGAHTAFHAALEAVARNRRDLLQEILMINPLTFYWEEGMSLAIPSDVQNLHDAAYYRQSMRDLGKWKKLLTGKASTGYILHYVTGRVRSLCRDRIKVIKEILFNQQSRLSLDFKRIIDQDIKIRFLLSSSDPGHDILKSEARRALRKGMAAGQIALDLVAGADHTFSKKEKRDQLLAWVRTAYGENQMK